MSPAQVAADSECAPAAPPDPPPRGARFACTHSRLPEANYATSARIAGTRSRETPPRA